MRYNCPFLHVATWSDHTSRVAVVCTPEDLGKQTVVSALTQKTSPAAGQDTELDLGESREDNYAGENPSCSVRNIRLGPV